MVYWQFYLKRECGWQMAVPWGWVAITQGQRQNSTNQAEQSYHAVVLSVEFKCIVRDFSELSSVNSETELQYITTDQKQLRYI